MIFSHEFVKKFKKILIRLYGYEEYMDFLVLPFKKLVYLPLLNYSDKIDYKDLLELAKNNKFQIRVLNFEYNEFKKNDPIVMRIDLENKTSVDIFNNIKSKNKNIIKNSIKRNNFVLKKGNSKELIEDFYEIFSATMYKHGTPVFDKRLFYYLVDEFKDDIQFYVVYENYKLVAGMCLLFDKEIAWYPWGGVMKEYSKKLAGYYIYWKMIEDISNMNRYKILDLGRSGFEGETYKFKKKFGAYPVKIDIIKNKNIDIYSKYAFASTIWKTLPKNLVDFIGPKLCKYLEDL